MSYTGLQLRCLRSLVTLTQTPITTKRSEDGCARREKKNQNQTQKNKAKTKGFSIFEVPIPNLHIQNTSKKGSEFFDRKKERRRTRILAKDRQPARNNGEGAIE